VTLEFKKFSSFIFLLIFLTLTMPILSSPFQLANNVNAETDSNSDDAGDGGSEDKDDEGDDDSKDEGDDDSKDEGDDDSKDEGDDDSKDEGDDDSRDDDSKDEGDDDSKDDADDQTSHQKSDNSQTSETDNIQTSDIQGTSLLDSILSHFQSTPSQTSVDSEQNFQELSNVNSLLENCDLADPACSETPCDPADPACSETPCDPADPACSETPCDPADPACEPGSCDSGDPAWNTESDCADGVDNDGDDAIDGEDADCSAGGPLPPNEREKFCSDDVDNDGNGKIDDLNECESDCNDGTDNDADGKIDAEDNDCQSGGPCPLCSPTGGGAGSNNDDRRDNGDVIRDVSTDNRNVNDGTSNGDNGNVNDGTSNGDNGNANDGTSNGDPIQSLLSQAQAQAVQGENGEKVYYVLIENANNETNFVPNKVTLTDGFTVFWINKDNSKDHSLTITNDSGKPLFSSAVQSNNFVKYKFQTEGTYLYSDPDNPQFNGTITILKRGLGSEYEISKPVQGLNLILSSLGLK
jgi:plastocyanin